jgi:hypothetical protein
LGEAEDIITTMMKLAEWWESNQLKVTERLSGTDAELSIYQ